MTDGTSKPPHCIASSFSFDDAFHHLKDLLYLRETLAMDFGNELDSDCDLDDKGRTLLCRWEQFG